MEVTEKATEKSHNNKKLAHTFNNSLVSTAKQ